MGRIDRTAALVSEANDAVTSCMLVVTAIVVAAVAVVSVDAADVEAKSAESAAVVSRTIVAVLVLMDSMDSAAFIVVAAA